MLKPTPTSLTGLLALVLAPALLTGCPIYVDGYNAYPTYGSDYGSPDITVVGSAPVNIDYGAPVYTSGDSKGLNPIIDSFTQNISQVRAGQPVTFTVVAHDPNRGVLQYNWSATGGTLSTNTGRVVAWDPPTESGIYTVSVVLSNQNGGVATGSLNLTVHGTGTPAPIAVPTLTPQAPVVVVPIATPSPIFTLPPSPTPAPLVSVAPAPPSPTPAPLAVIDGTKGIVTGIVKTDAGPLEGCEVILDSNESKTPFVNAVLTDATGAFRFVNVPPDTKLRVMASKSGYGEKDAVITALKGQETQFNFDGTYALTKTP